MKRTRIQSSLLAGTLLVAAGAAGCSSGPQWTETSGQEAVVTSEIDIQDIEKAAGELAASLLEAGVVTGASKPPVIDRQLMTFVNNTTQRFDSTRVLDKVMGWIGDSARVMMVTDEMRKTAFLENRKLPKPDYRLELNLTEDRATAGKIRQRAYSFRMKLIQPATGSIVWADEVQIVKQGKRATMGL